jgi:serine/threonine-protein phosphatase 4 catalytic subunit
MKEDYNIKSMSAANASSHNADLDRQIEQLKRCECIKESEVRDLCNSARDILLEESNIQNIYSPITVAIFT